MLEQVAMATLLRLLSCDARQWYGVQCWRFSRLQRLQAISAALQLPYHQTPCQYLTQQEGEYMSAALHVQDASPPQPEHIAARASPCHLRLLSPYAVSATGTVSRVHREQESEPEGALLSFLPPKPMPGIPARAAPVPSGHTTTRTSESAWKKNSRIWRRWTLARVYRYRGCVSCTHLESSSQAGTGRPCTPITTYQWSSTTIHSTKRSTIVHSDPLITTPWGAPLMP